MSDRSAGTLFNPYFDIGDRTMKFCCRVHEIVVQIVWQVLQAVYRYDVRLIVFFVFGTLILGDSLT